MGVGSFYVAASLGFEPRQRDPESLVLPLHHEAMVAEQLRANYTCVQPLGRHRRNIAKMPKSE